MLHCVHAVSEVHVSQPALQHVRPTPEASQVTIAPVESQTPTVPVEHATHAVSTSAALIPESENVPALQVDAHVPSAWRRSVVHSVHILVPGPEQTLHPVSSHAMSPQVSTPDSVQPS